MEVGAIATIENDTLEKVENRVMHMKNGMMETGLLLIIIDLNTQARYVKPVPQSINVMLLNSNSR